MVNLNPPEIYPMTSDADDDLQEPPHATTAHSFEESFYAQLDAGGIMTSRARGKKGLAWNNLGQTGKGPSTNFPWRPAQSSTTDMRWQPDLDRASRYGRGSNSQRDGDDDGEPDPAMFRRMQPPSGTFERQVPQEVPPPDRECDTQQQDRPPNVHLREPWMPQEPFPPGLNPRHSAGFQTEGGTWLFMPFGEEPDRDEQPPPGSGQKNPRRRRRRNRHGPPSGGPSSHGTEEQAESEVPTIDPSVDPDGFDAAPQRDPEPQRGAPPIQGRVPRAGSGGAGGSHRSPVGSREPARSSQGTTWMSMMGPQKGVKFRGGAPPQPPSWKYQPGDVRAFERYERKVKLWQMQIRFYMTRAEAGLMLYSSLTGEAEQQLEFADMSKIFHEDGVQFVLDQLKRHVLHEYEHIYRYNMETLRGFINRYRRIEASLMAIGIDVSLTYDNEARGSRLLDRAKLTLEQQRMVLVGTGQRMDFDSVASALCMQFPEYRPAPPIAGKGDHNKGKGDGRGHHNSNQSSHQSPHRRSDGRFSSQQSKPQKVLETVVEEQHGEEDDAPSNEDADGVDEGDQPEHEEGDEDFDAAEDAEGDNHDFDDLARVLTVTAKKLAAMTQGRKFRNGSKK